MKPHEKIELLVDRALSTQNRGKLNNWSQGFLANIRTILGKARSPETALSMNQKGKVYSILKDAKISTDI